MSSSPCQKCGAETRHYPCASCGWQPPEQTNEYQTLRGAHEAERERGNRLSKRVRELETLVYEAVDGLPAPPSTSWYARARKLDKRCPTS